MKIYVLEYSFDEYEPYEVRGVFSSPDKALEYVHTHDKDTKDTIWSDNELGWRDLIHADGKRRKHHAQYSIKVMTIDHIED